MAGSNGIVAITSVDAFRKRMPGKSNGGARSVDILRKSKNIAEKATKHAGQNNARRFCIGGMIVERCRRE